MATKRSRSWVDPLPAQGELCTLDLDSAGQVQAASRSCEVLFQRESGSLIGAPLESLLQGFVPGEGEEGLAEAAACRPGRPCPVRVFWRRQPTGALSLFLLDLETLSRLSASESAAAARVAALLGHEIRNPLASVKLATQALARVGSLDDRAQRRLAIVMREVRTIERILAAVGEQVRPRAHEPRVPTQLAPLLAEVAAEAAPVLAELGCKLEVRAPAQCAAALSGRRVKLALAHLVALAAHGAASLPLPLSLSAGAAEDGGCWLEVRAPHAIQGRPSGSELSLALAEAVAKEHGGSLETGGDAGTVVLRIWIAGQDR